MTRVAQMAVMAHNSSGVSISSACETTVVASNPSNTSVTFSWMMLACALVSLFRTIEPRLILPISPTVTLGNEDRVSDRDIIIAYVIISRCCRSSDTGSFRVIGATGVGKSSVKRPSLSDNLLY